MRTLQHLHFATRRPVESPGVALSAVLSRAFGIGATVAALSVAYGMLLHGLATPAYATTVAIGHRSPWYSPARQELQAGGFRPLHPALPHDPRRRTSSSCRA